jgi:hypothetical protein
MAKLTLEGSARSVLAARVLVTAKELKKANDVPLNMDHALTVRWLLLVVVYTFKTLF